MQSLPITFLNIQKAVEYLKTGKVVIHPTDTCYGMAVDITNPVAVRQVCQLKQMPETKPMSIIVSNLKMLQEYAKLVSIAEKLVKKYLPGPLTLLLPKTNKVPSYFAANSQYIGIRMPSDPISCKLAALLGNPITTTSANITGQSPAYSISKIKNYFNNQDVLLLDGGDLEKRKPSTIIKIIENKIQVIRQGEFQINRFL